MVPIDSSGSNSGCSEIRRPLLRRRDIDDDYEEQEEISAGTEAIPRRRKQRKKSTIPVVSSSSPLPPTSKMTWTKDNELAILKGIVDYQKEKDFSYGSEWDLFYNHVKGLVDMDFSKIQLQNKVRKIKNRFSDIIERCKDGEGVTFTSADDEAVFRLSTIIWGNKETECVSDQPEEEVHVPMDDVPGPDREPTRVANDQEEDCSDEICVLQEVLEASTVFRTRGKDHQKMLCLNVKNLTAQRKKELNSEWKAILYEEMKLNIKKLTFEAKLANA